MSVVIGYRRGTAGLPANMETKEVPVGSDMVLGFNSEDGNRPMLFSKDSLGGNTYTWVKYATDATGTTGFSDSPTGCAYIGLAFNKPTAAASTNPADYTWLPIQWLAEFLDRLTALEVGQGSNCYGYATLALLSADLIPPDQSIAYVTNDATPANNGTYRKVGASGSGSWVQSSFDRVAIVEAALIQMQTDSVARDNLVAALMPLTEVVSQSYDAANTSGACSTSYYGYAGAMTLVAPFDRVSIVLTTQVAAIDVVVEIRKADFTVVASATIRTGDVGTATYYGKFDQRITSALLGGAVYYLAYHEATFSCKIAHPSNLDLHADVANQTTYRAEYYNSGQWWYTNGLVKWFPVFSVYDSWAGPDDTLLLSQADYTALQGDLALLATDIAAVEASLSQAQTDSIARDNQFAARMPLPAAVSQSYASADTSGACSTLYYGYAGAMILVSPFDRVAIVLTTQDAMLDVVVEIRKSDFATVVANATIRTGPAGTGTYYAKFDQQITSALLGSSVYYLAYHEATFATTVAHPNNLALDANVANQTTYPAIHYNSGQWWYSTEDVKWFPVFSVYDSTIEVDDCILASEKSVAEVESLFTPVAEAAAVTRKLGNLTPVAISTRITQTADYTYSANAAYSMRSWQVQQHILADKIINTVSVPLSRDLYHDTVFTSPILVRIGKNDHWLYQHTVTVDELASYNALTSSSPLADFDYYVEFPDLGLAAGDTLSVAWECSGDDLMSMIFGPVADPAAEGAEGLVVQSTTPGLVAALTCPTVITIVRVFSLRVRAYYRHYVTPVTDKTPLTLLAPKKIYTVKNNKITGATADGRRNAIPIYLDHCVKGISSEPDFYFADTGTDKVALFSPESYDDGTAITHGDTESYSHTFDIIGGTLYTDTSITVEQISTLESVGASSFPKIMVMGDSITAGTNSTINVPSGSACQYWAHLREEWEKARIDNGDTGHDCLLVGRDTFKTWDLTYGGISGRTLRAGVEGHSGWDTTDHLHMSRWWHENTQGLWDLLGLGDGTGTDYTGSAAQLVTINTTPEGKYPPTDTAAFLAYINSELSGSAATYLEAVALLDAAQAAPNNPFYDKTVAASNNYAFSLATYLSRFKTLANDGTTRLTVGSTAGSAVTDANAYDVCLPTHIIIQHSHNDGNAPWIGTNYRRLTDAIQAEYAANGWGPVHIGISIVDFVGTYFPSRYPDFDRSSSALWVRESSHAQSYDNMQRIFDEFWVSSANENSEHIYILPTYHVQPTAWAIPYREIPLPEYYYSGLNQHSYKKMWGSLPPLHPNGIFHRAIGLSMYAWLRYTLSL